jgi:hypothetical protein
MPTPIDCTITIVSNTIVGNNITSNNIASNTIASNNTDRQHKLPTTPCHPQHGTTPTSAPTAVIIVGNTDRQHD